MEHAIVIERAGVNDAGVVAPLMDAYRVFYRKPPDLDAAHAFLRERLERQESIVLMALRSSTREHRASPLGFAQLYPSFTTVGLGARWTLSDLFVDPSARRSGVGEALVRACMDHCRSSGAQGLQLLTEQANSGAKRLYERLGWTADREYQRYTWRA
jgi:ribosomal protein S18 acetylase RimI-like enzyme